MPIIMPDKQRVEEIAYFDPRRSIYERRMGEPGEFTQFGAFIPVLPPRAHASITHWHSNEDERVYVQEGEIQTNQSSFASQPPHRGSKPAFQRCPNFARILRSTTSSIEDLVAST